MPAQPPPSRLSPRALLRLPHRLCNPPPAVGKVRSCAATPILDVRLEDVLARRHLPPIGLKDFEEYLLYVELAPENLYFVLWLKDYTLRYNAWVQREKSSQKDGPSKTSRQKFAVPPTPDPALAMFYLRAKQTFFTPNGVYELNIPSDVLAPFHCAPPPQEHGRSSLWHTQSIHPDPAVFSEVATEAQYMLDASLKRFLRAAYTNVGSQRAACGIVGGCFFVLVSGVVPLVLTTGRWNIGPHGRLVRLAALPGLWFGLTVLIASLQGVCLMIYFFGDLRQLRKFELARPTISRPIPVSASPSRPAPLPEKAVEGVSPPTSPPRPAHISTSSLVETSCDSCESEGSCNEIDISPAYFDDIPAPEGPATASCLHRPEYRLSPSLLTYIEPAHVRPSVRATGLSISTSAADSPVPVDPRPSKRILWKSASDSEYGPTAGFIPSDHSTTSLAKSLRSQRSACYFDFDALPVSLPLPPASATVGDPSSPHPSSSVHSLTGVASLFGRTQYKYASPPVSSTPTTDSTRRKRFSFAMLIPSFTAGVPAFATPLTHIQSPVVRRAQWEVVVRAGIVAAVIAGGVTGIVVGVVP